ncbi:MAG: FAD-binding oxidoreductase [Candidimonas sp.]|nr:MAG: FAD-binding oxidoreductase [Candidimonas sp.]
MAATLGPESIARRGADVIVIGAGLHGCSVALNLARHGARVVVLEKDYSGRHASGVNAGGVRTLGRHPAEIPLALAARDLWHRIGDLVDDDCGFASVGQIQIAENDDEASQLRARVQTLAASGYDHERWLDAEELHARVPALVPWVSGALIAEADGVADPFCTVLAFRRKATALGARFVEGVAAHAAMPVAGQWQVSTSSGVFFAPRIVNCAGAWAGRFASQWGEPVPLSPIAPMMMVTLRMRRFLHPVILGTGRALSLKQRANGTVLIGGARRARLDHSRERISLCLPSLAASARMVCELFPFMRDAVVARAWAGIEARMPDDLPVIGRSSRHESAFHAFGFSAHGFELGPIVGRIIAELLTSGSTQLPISSFSISRFQKEKRT